MKVKVDMKASANKKMTIVFILVMIFSLVSFLGRRSKKKKPVPVNQKEQIHAVNEVQISTVPLIDHSSPNNQSVVNIKFHEDWGRDPFEFPKNNVGTGNANSSPKEYLPRFTLSAIILDGGRSSAIINGEFYSVGQSVSGFTIINISTDRVTLKRATRTLVLNLR
jgi:hypothetical protein